jgi:DNA-binding NarL/FixJ family response regulator
MGIRALCLANDTNSYDLTHLFAKYCDEFQVVNTLAQATAIFSKSLDVASSLPHIGLIVADIPAGGINLAEYVLGRIRPNAYFALQHRAPNFVVFDPAGDINAARRALQLGVTEYLLPADLNATYLDNLITQLDFSSFETRASGVDAHAGLHPPTGNNNAAVPGLRLSSVEAAIVNCLTHNNGEPMSARSIVHAVLGRDVDEDRAASLIRPHISRLRSKVEPTPQMPQRLLTIRGKGYVLVQG